MRVAPALLVTLAVAGSLRGQQPVATPLRLPTAAISGIVVDGATGQPLTGAVVYLGGGMRRASVESRQTTDPHGRFVFTELPAAENLTLAASLPGYFEGGFGSSRFSENTLSEATIAIGDGEWRSNIRVVLWKPSVIEGTVRDERDEPVVGVEVRAIALLRIAGADQPAGGPFARTDDRGRYRITGLDQGRYVVAVPSVQSSIGVTRTEADVQNTLERIFAAAAAVGEAPVVPTMDAAGGTRVALGRYPTPPAAKNGEVTAYPVTFMPSASILPAATVIDLARGTTRSAADVTLRPVPVVDITGRVDGTGPLSNLPMRLMAAGSERLGIGFETGLARTEDDGSFRLVNIPAGTYTLEVPSRITEYLVSPVGLETEGVSRPPGFGQVGGSINAMGGPRSGVYLSDHTVAMRSDASSPPARSDRANPAWGRVTVDANVRVSGIVLPLKGSGSIAGRLRFEGDTTGVSPAMMTVSVVADAADGDASRGAPSLAVTGRGGDSEFELSGLGLGRYFLRQRLSRTWLVKSVTQGGRDYTDTPFDVSDADRIGDVVITLTRSGASLRGRVTGADGAPAFGLRVGAFPADRMAWTNFGTRPSRIAEAVTSTSGAYQIQPLPAGDYFVTLVPDNARDTWRSPEFFSSVASSAPRVTLEWAGERTQDLRVGRP